MEDVKKITQPELKKILAYSPDTGLFSWKISTGSAKIGKIAGCDDGKGYIRIVFGHKKHKAHHLAFLYMTGEYPDPEVDHIDHDGKNNKWANLREVTSIENGMNVSLRRTNTSGHIGVKKRKGASKWQAIIKIKGKEINLGRYEIYEDACKAREMADKKYGFHENHGLKKRYNQGSSPDNN